jgi:hypothetical protein
VENDIPSLRECGGDTKPNRADFCEFEPQRVQDSTESYGTERILQRKCSERDTFQKAVNPPMSPPAKHRAPQSSTSDNESSVRERVTPVPAPSSAPAIPSAAPPASMSSRDRLEAKLNVARNVLANLPVSDDRARLLHVAIMRRDEALLDGVLSALGVPSSPSFPPPPSR